MSPRPPADWPDLAGGRHGMDRESDATCWRSGGGPRRRPSPSSYAREPRRRCALARRAPVARLQAGRRGEVTAGAESTDHDASPVQAGIRALLACPLAHVVRLVGRDRGVLLRRDLEVDVEHCHPGFRGGVATQEVGHLRVAHQERPAVQVYVLRCRGSCRPGTVDVHPDPAVPGRHPDPLGSRWVAAREPQLVAVPDGPRRRHLQQPGGEVVARVHDGPPVPARLDVRTVSRGSPGSARERSSPPRSTPSRR